MKIIRKGNEKALFGESNLLLAAHNDYRYAVEQYKAAVESVRRTCQNEIDRFALGRSHKPDNSLGLLQGRAVEVDRLAAVACAKLDSLSAVEHHFKVYIESAHYPHEIVDLEDKMLNEDVPDCECAEPLLEPGEVGRVQCGKCGGAKEVR